MISAWLFYFYNLTASVPFVSFDDLSPKNGTESERVEALQGQVIQVRGFWYPLPTGGGILSPHPQLKSCCLQKPSKIVTQLLVNGPLVATLSPQRALTLEGEFYIRPKYNVEGELIQLYVLDEARELEKKSSLPSSLLFLIPLAAVVLLLIRYFILKWRVL